MSTAEKDKTEYYIIFIILFIFTYIWQEEMSIHPEKVYKYT